MMRASTEKQSFIPDFSTIPYSGTSQARHASGDQPELPWLNSLPGHPPFARGPYLSMYTRRPWTIRQYAGFSTAAETNRFYKRALKRGQRGLSVAFDLPTHRGFDSDNPDIAGDVGLAGVAIDTVEDMNALFEDIPLSDVSVSMTMNGAVIPVMAMFIVSAQEQGVRTEDLQGTIQNDVLKEFMVRNTYIYPPDHSLRIVTDVLVYCSRNLPKFNPISVSGYHMQEAGATPDLELAYTLANGFSYVRAAIDAGLNVDQFAPRISFFWSIGTDFFTEIAKLRAARILWAEGMQVYQPTSSKSLCLRCHCQTSGWSLTAQSARNNISRTATEALAAVFGHTQSLHTNGFDEALALPSEESAQIARDTQLILQHEAGSRAFIDPWCGSHHLESLTQQMVVRAKQHMKEIDSHGGMISAIRAGTPKARIEQAAIRTQARIDAGLQTIVGLNRYQKSIDESDTASSEHTPFDLRSIDSDAVRRTQMDALERTRRTRDAGICNDELKRLTEVARSSDQNLLEQAIKAARARATLGEISEALGKVMSLHSAPVRLQTGVYADTMGSQEFDVVRIRQMVRDFIENFRKPPSILVAKIGQDGHDRGQKTIAGAFADFGFDVHTGALFQTPRAVAEQARDLDVHAIGISSLTAGHRTLIPELRVELQRLNVTSLLFVGGVIPPEDVPFLKSGSEVVEVFLPGTRALDAAEIVLESLNQFAGFAQPPEISAS